MDCPIVSDSNEINRRSWNGLNKWLGTTLVEPFTFQRNGFRVHLIDTPGFDSIGSSDAALLQDVAVCLNNAYISGAQISGIIYLHPINSTRVQGSAMKCLRIIKKICGPEALSLILLGSTMWDKEDPEIAKRRQDELTRTADFWGSMIEDGCKTFRFLNDQASALLACDYLIEQRRKERFREVTLALQHQMVNECRALNATDAGMEVEREILQFKQICNSKIEEAREEAERAVLMNNEEAEKDFATRQLQLQVQLVASERALESICGDMMTLQVQSENQLRDKLDQLRRDEQRDQSLLSERQRELDRLDMHLRELNDELELSHTTSTTELILRPPAYLPTTYTPTARTIQPPVSRTASSKPWPRLAEVQAVSENSARCKNEIETYRERQAFRRRRIETCVNRLGVGAGIIGAGFQ